MASTARTVVLSQALHMAHEPVKSFLESAGNGPLATKAAETVATAAAAFPVANDAVQRALTAAGGRGAGAAGALAVEVAQGGGGGLSCGPNREGGKTGEEARVMNSGAMNEVGGGRGVSAGEEILAMERDDSTARVSACQEAMESWWEQQRAALEEGLRDREAQAADRRCIFMWRTDRHAQVCVMCIRSLRALGVAHELVS